VTSHELIATQGHSSDGRSVILPESIASIGHNRRAAQLVSPRLQNMGLTNISTCLQQDLHAASIDTGEINFLYH
jgi:hypothetical protein